MHKHEWILFTSFYHGTRHVGDCHPRLVSILGLGISTLGVCRNHMLGTGTCIVHVETEGSGALISELMKYMYFLVLL